MCNAYRHGCFFLISKGKNIFSLIKLSKEKSIDFQEAYAFLLFYAI